MRNIRPVLCWLPDLLSNIAVSMCTGVYTGIIVSRYINIEGQLEAARAKVIRLPDLGTVIFDIADEDTARLRCMSLFIEQASYARTIGDFRMAYRLVDLGRRVEAELMEVWSAVRKCELRGDARGVEVEIARVSPIMNGALKYIEEMKTDWVVLLIGKRATMCYRRLRARSEQFQKYINGEAEDWK